MSQTHASLYQRDGCIHFLYIVNTNLSVIPCFYTAKSVDVQIVAYQ